MSYFASEYTIHFDDTMAYGSHHFLTGFKFQCASRESFLFGERIFDVPGVREALDSIYLLTADAYSRNLNAARLGERIVILLSIEDWHRASARFCYRTIRSDGQPICAGFQTLICVDAQTNLPIPLPDPLWHAMEAMREIEEPILQKSFRDRVLAGGSQLSTLFGKPETESAVEYLRQRYPSPQVIGAIKESQQPERQTTVASADHSEKHSQEVWVFAGQGALDTGLLSQRVTTYKKLQSSASNELRECADVAQELLGGNPLGLIGGIESDCDAAIEEMPSLTQVAIYLQNVLGAKIAGLQGQSADIVMGHSFGEIAAFQISGCFDLLTGTQLVCERVRAMSEHAPPDGDLLIVFAERSRIATELRFAGVSQVVIAGRNHPNQTVLSGPRDQICELASYLRNLDIKCMTIPTANSFHHPRLRKAALAWSQRIKNLDLKAPQRPLYSPNGRRFISSSDDIAVTLSNQLLRPFDLQGAVEDLTEVGAKRFVDCGSTGSLAKLLEKAGAEQSMVVNGKSHVHRHSSDHALIPVESKTTSNRNGEHHIANGHAKSATASQPQSKTEQNSAPPIAIVGQGCLLPANADSPEQLHRAIVEQRNGIVDQRSFDSNWTEDFYANPLQPDRSTSYLTGRVNDAQIVCPQGFNEGTFVSFSRAQQLLCAALAPCVESLRDAQRIKCFIGATADGFEDHDLVTSLQYAGIDPHDPEVDRLFGSAISAGRGPFASIKEVIDNMIRPGLEIVMVDAACASSLYAAALGMQALETDKADAVIAGGIFCPGPGNSCLFSQFNGTTATGCRPFDASSDGVVFSEGAAVVTLRRLEDAQRQNLPIAAVVRGFGLSSDGRSSSANVPQSNGQLLSLQRCYSNYGIDRASIDAIEAHGTSTPVGDATELETLGQFYGSRPGQDVLVHSLKGVLGHAGWAAGTASLIAACQYLRNGEFPAQANFRNPSDALLQSSLTVLQDNRKLPKRSRVAVDGFGFGGANAHFVLEKYESNGAGTKRTSNGHLLRSNETFAESKSEGDELVVVAHHRIAPVAGNRFERQYKLSNKHVLLPDLAEDMDISQALAVSLADGVFAKLPDINSEIRESTGMILALNGKTERGVEATARILTPRLRRQLSGLEQESEKLTTVLNDSRPSGPYTLQCMMPNVASGRAALQLDLKGPNFVVDADDHSLNAAFDSAELLLNSKHPQQRLCIVSSIQANASLCEKQLQGHSELAAAFLVTTRSTALELGLETIAEVESLREILSAEEQGISAKIQQIIQVLNRDTNQNGQPEDTVSDSRPSKTIQKANEPTHTIHTPVWVQWEGANDVVSETDSRSKLAVAWADSQNVGALREELSRRGSYKLILIKSDLTHDVPCDEDNLFVVDWNDQQSIQCCLEMAAEFDPEVVIGFDSPQSWDLEQALESVSQHPVGELIFLLAQRMESRLRNEEVEFWGLFFDSFRDVTHPITGATAGLLKSIRRELKTRNVTIAYTRELSLPDALNRLGQESRRMSNEAEVVFDGPLRKVLRLQETSPAGHVEPKELLNSDSVVVATGGAQGVTAVLMESLLKKYQCTVVAIGRSNPENGPADQDRWEEIFYKEFVRQHPGVNGAKMKLAYERTRATWETNRTIQGLQATGGHFEYLQADVTQPEQVDQAIRQIVAKFGKIDLVVHGAGIQLSKQLKDRSLDEFRRTFAVKVRGLKNLVDSARRALGRVPDVLALTSAFSIFGNDGQHDYGAANETLDRLCNLGRAQNKVWNSIAWLAWDGIGMTRGSEYQALAKKRRLSSLTRETGPPFFLQVLSGESDAATHVPLSCQERSTYDVSTVPASTSGRVIECPLSLERMQWLQHHQVRDNPTVPGAWILDRMVDTALKFQPQTKQFRTATIEDISFSRFLRPQDHRLFPPRIVAIQQSDGIQVRVLGDSRHPNGTLLIKDVVFAQATVHFCESNTCEIPELGRFHLRPRLADQLSDPYCSQLDGNVKLSGPFDCLDEIRIESSGRNASYAIQDRCDQSNANRIPFMLLDATWRMGAMYASPNSSELYVPVQIEQVSVPIDLENPNGQVQDGTIQSTPPQVVDDIALWRRSEARDSEGRLQIVVKNATAKRME